MFTSEKKIPYLLMTEGQRHDLMKQNSSIYFKGFMTENMHVSEETHDAMVSFVSRYGNVEPRATLVVLQTLDECLGLKEKILSSSDRDVQSVLGSEFFDRLLRVTEELKKLGDEEIDLHEGHILIHANKVYEKC
jgi:hypothetical protein